jgi:hypothetical protein
MKTIGPPLPNWPNERARLAVSGAEIAGEGLSRWIRDNWPKAP